MDFKKGWKTKLIEKLTSKSVTYLVNASGLLLLANIIVTGLGALRIPLVTWMIPKDQVGVLGIVLSWLPFVNLLSLPGIDSSAYHYVSKGHLRAFKIGVIHRLRWSLLSSIAFGAGAVFWYFKGENQTAWLFLITALSFPFTYALTSSAGILGAVQNFKGLFWYRVLEALTDFFGFLPLFLSFYFINQIITFYTFNQAASAAMQLSVVVLLIIALQKRESKAFEPDDEKEIVRYGKHLTAITGISVLQSRVDAFLVGLFQPLEVMADYSIALILQEQIRRLWRIYATIRYPVLVLIPRKKRIKQFVREGILLMIALTGTSILISLLAHWLVPVLLPPSYAGSLVYLDILFVAILAAMPGNMVEMFFRTEQDERSQYIIRGTSAVWGVVFPVIFLFFFGAIGAAIGRIFANLAFSIIAFIVIKRKKVMDNYDLDV